MSRVYIGTSLVRTKSLTSDRVRAPLSFDFCFDHSFEQQIKSKFQLSSVKCEEYLFIAGYCPCRVKVSIIQIANTNYELPKVIRVFYFK